MKSRARDMIVNESLWFEHLDVDNFIFVVSTIGAVHDESPDAARFHFNLMNRVRKTVWSPPLRQMFGIGPNFPHKFTRRIEEARDNYFSICCFSHTFPRGAPAISNSRQACRTIRSNRCWSYHSCSPAGQHAAESFSFCQQRLQK